MITDLLAPRAVSGPHGVYRELREHAPITESSWHRPDELPLIPVTATTGASPPIR